ncbi:sec-independent protein translocase protein TatB [Chitinivorax tropicus]|uniref:Sec-independent protein translocase protein TatB n=1 Tax=Chitinivorax tropicus TaxID=714531 RepID=A0A840MV69_9PROT|nr:Sec-independent protein translocase protein TatB [Chitinivorax tropicus]MBB5019071.1 sec-independent protein translocase protein TatB [Chitinivorax tropicus]
MFDVSFGEMVTIGVVALVVIGPERLPKVARTLGHLVGRAQRYVAQVKADVSREMELDELRKVQTEFTQAAQQFEHSIHQEVQASQQAIQQLDGDASQFSQQLRNDILGRAPAPELMQPVDEYSYDLFAQPPHSAPPNSPQVDPDKLAFYQSQLDLFADVPEHAPPPPHVAATRPDSTHA